MTTAPPLSYGFQCNICGYHIIVPIDEAAMETCVFCESCHNIVPIPDPQTP